MTVEQQIIWTSDFKDSIKAVGSFSKDANKSIKSIEKSFGALKAVAIGAVGFLAGRQIVNAIGKVTQAASIQEDAINNLNTAMALSGEFSLAASQEMQNFASQIQQTTRFGDEAVLQQLALAKAFGASNEQARQITTAAIELASATGKSLDEATRQVSKTLGGFAGELGEVNPAIKALTQEQLKAGEAAKVLIAQYGGSAAGQVNTFSGALQQLDNVQGDLNETIGSFITKNPLVIAGIKFATDAFTKLGEFLNKNSGYLIDFVNNGLIKVIEAFGWLLKAGKPIITVFAAIVALIVKFTAKLAQAVIAVFEFALSFKIVRVVVNAVADAFRLMAASFLDAIGGMLELLSKLPGVGSELDGAKESVNSLRDGFVEAFGKDVTDDIGNLLKKAKDFAKGIDENAVGSVEHLKSGIDSAVDKINDLTTAMRKASSQKLSITPTVNLAGGAGTLGSVFDGAINFFKETFSPDSISNAFQSVTSAFSQVSQLSFGDLKAGFTNIGQALSNTWENIKSIKLEDIGTALSNVGSKIAEGFSTGGTLFLDFMQGGFIERTLNAFKGITDLPDKFKNFGDIIKGLLKGLVRAIPKAFDAVIKMLPSLAQGLVKVFEKLVDLVVQKGPALFSALVDAALSFVDAIVKALPRLIAIIPKLVDKLAKAIPKLIRIILQGLPAIIKALAEAIPEIVRSLAAAIPEIVIAIAENIAPVILALVQGIIEAIPAIVFALVDELILKGGIFRIIGAILQAIPQIALALVQGVLRGLATAGGPVFSGLAKTFSSGIKLPKLQVPAAFKNPPFIGKLNNLFSPTGNPLYQKLEELFGNPPFLQKLEEILKSFDPGKAFGGGKGKKGPVTGIKGSPLAEGGFVPKGFPNDTFPARLTSGELVIPPGDTERLARFLDAAERGGQSFGVGNVESLISRLERSTEKQVQINLKIGEQELANILLNLNRQGFRTA